ncbi:MAG: sulfotransferase [Alteromonadaceae bacterium]|nr:sulfotransferase [Alteromonadaceae bacterium]
MKVDFFIVGAMRSGTSSIRDQLDLDPKINMARGEPMFFSNDKKYKEGIDDYHSLFDWDKREIILRGEKSPRYAVSASAPRRIFEYNPNAKIIWMLRNPVKRAFSHYVHAVYRAGDAAISLDEAIERNDELARMNSTMAYVFRSQYEKQLHPWSEYFPNQKVVILEELITSPEEVMSDVYDYLDVEPGVKLEFLKHSKEKVDQAKEKIEARHQMTSEQKMKLSQLLEPTVNKVEEFLGRRLDQWRS